jgi:hypothetical protein
MSPFCLGDKPPGAPIFQELRMKIANLFIYGYVSEPVTVSVMPEDTALTILSKCGLDGCFLVRESEPQRRYEDSDTPYADLTDAENLFAVLPDGD